MLTKVPEVPERINQILEQFRINFKVNAVNA